MAPAMVLAVTLIACSHDANRTAGHPFCSTHYDSIQSFPVKLSRNRMDQFFHPPPIIPALNQPSMILLLLLLPLLPTPRAPTCYVMSCPATLQ